jgi:hypothetical protein
MEKERQIIWEVPGISDECLSDQNKIMLLNQK